MMSCISCFIINLFLCYVFLSNILLCFNILSFIIYFIITSRIIGKFISKINQYSLIHCFHCHNCIQNTEYYCKVGIVSVILNNYRLVVYCINFI